MLNYSLLSNRYNVRKMNTKDVPLILSLCSNNEIYYRYYPPLPTDKSIIHDLTALPPNKTVEDKYYLGYYDDNSLIAVLDLIMSFPSKDIAFIGFFMCDIHVQNKGIGSFIINELCASLKANGMSGVRLAFVKSNPQASHFWKKNDFKEIIETEQDGISLVIAERKL